MSVLKRVILIVLDSAGIGAMPDAPKYGDNNVNTLRHIADNIEGFSLPNMESLGLYKLIGLSSDAKLKGSFCKLAEKSAGKDTTTGHWEMVGCIREKPFPVYPNGFPNELIKEFEEKSGYKTIGNIASSGTEIIERLGEEHLTSKALIVYTSADSVFQIAAHEEIISREELYRVCSIARKILTGKHAVARVIARPFIGSKGNFSRTDGRHDFSLKPEGITALDRIKDTGLSVFGIGKINDIYAGAGITDYVYSSSNSDGMNKLIKSMDNIHNGLIFLNLVDFDMKYGHRRDVKGYYNALVEFDNFIPKLISKMKDDDILMITADHGCDPTYTGTDHTREFIPLLISGKHCISGKDLGLRDSFADIGRSILDMLSINPGNVCGKSFMEEIIC